MTKVKTGGIATESTRKGVKIEPRGRGAKTNSGGWAVRSWGWSRFATLQVVVEILRGVAGVVGRCGQREAAATTAAELESLYEMGPVWFTQASEIGKKKVLDTTWKGAAFGAGWLSLIQLLLA